MPGSSCAVFLDSVTKIYSGPTDVVVFRDASLCVRLGEFVGVFAPSGMGKTTLILLISGILRPDSGKIYVLGREITSMDRDALALFRRRNIGVVFQFFNLIPTLTVLENIMLPMELNGVPSREAEHRARMLLRSVGLAEKAHSFPHRLSGGEQQRVAILRAIAHRPRILLADEPTGNLDEENKHLVFDLMREANKDGCTVIVATHDVDLASKYVSRAVGIRRKGFVELTQGYRRGGCCKPT